jgi:predicted PurR-regulated permease PerM
MATKQGGSEHLFVRHVLIVLGLAAVFFLIWQLRILLLMLFGAIVIASIFRAVADMICKYTRLPNALSTALSILLVLGSLAGLAALFGSHVAQQVTTLRETLRRRGRRWSNVSATSVSASRWISWWRQSPSRAAAVYPASAGRCSPLEAASPICSS